MMKLTGLFLALCLTGAVAQTTQSPFSCFLDATQQQSDKCISRLGEVFENGNVNFDNIEGYCSSYCALQFNSTLIERCQLSFIEGLCSMDDYGFCLSRNQTEFGVMLGQINTGPCYNTNCSDPTCYSAMQNLTCCIDGVSKVSDIIGVNLRNFLLPSGCTPPMCMVTLGGAAPTLVAMPLWAIMIVLFLVLSATM